MLSLEEISDASKPIAKIVGGRYKNKTIYLTDDLDECNSEGVRSQLLEFEELLDDFRPEVKRLRLSQFEINRLKQSFKKDIPPVDEHLYDLFMSMKEYQKTRSCKEINIYDGHLQVLPEYEKRQCVYVAGPSGSGKSTWIANYAKEWKRKTKGQIYVFSRLDEDDPIDALNPTRIQLDEDLIADPIDPSELANSLVIFDDIDTIPNAKIRKAVQALMQDILETGRHNNIWCLAASHQICNFNQTRSLLNESHMVTFFPSSGSSHAIKRLLSEYLSFTKQDIEKILKLKSRWVTVRKLAPQVVIYSGGAFLP